LSYAIYKKEKGKRQGRKKLPAGRRT